MQDYSLRQWLKPWVKPALAVLATLTILVAAMTAGWAGGVLFDLYHQVDHPRAFAADEPQLLTTLRLATFLFAFQAVVIALTLAAARRFDARFSAPVDQGERAPVELLSFRRPAGGPGLVALAILGLIAAAALFALFVYTYDRGAFMSDIGPFSTIMRTRAWWLILIVAAVGAPLAEEMLFRGFLYGLLRRSAFGVWTSAIFTSALWSALHPSYSLYGITAIAVIGIYLAFLRERSGSLVLPIACHSAYNASIILALAASPIATWATW